MSFGASKTEKSAMGEMSNLASTAKANSGEATDAGKNLLSIGGDNTNTGLDFFKTLLGGNQANTAALLQPQIQQANAGVNQQLQQLSTLMPRGGGRTEAMFNAATAPNSSLMQLFAGLRGGGADKLISTGMAQTGAGTNLFNTGNAALNTSLTGQNNVFRGAFDQRQANNQMWSGIGQGLFGLATTPFGGSNLNLLQRF